MSGKLRNVLGILAGVLILLSAGAHGLLGWPAMRAELGRIDLPPELLEGVRIGWLFGSVAMLAFGLVLVVIFGRRRGGERVATFPALIIAATYATFGVWAWLSSGREPFYLVFIVPGLLACAAALGRDAD